MEFSILHFDGDTEKDEKSCSLSRPPVIRLYIVFLCGHLQSIIYINMICLSYVTNIQKVMGLACDTFEESYLKTLDVPFLRILFLKLRPEINGTVTLKQYVTLHGSKCIRRSILEFLAYMIYGNARALEAVCDALQHHYVFK